MFISAENTQRTRWFAKIYPRVLFSMCVVLLLQTWLSPNLFAQEPDEGENPRDQHIEKLYLSTSPARDTSLDPRREAFESEAEYVRAIAKRDQHHAAEVLQATKYALQFFVRITAQDLSSSNPTAIESYLGDLVSHLNAPIERWSEYHFLVAFIVLAVLEKTNTDPDLVRALIVFDRVAQTLGRTVQPEQGTYARFYYPLMYRTLNYLFLRWQNPIGRSNGERCHDILITLAEENVLSRIAIHWRPWSADKKTDAAALVMRILDAMSATEGKSEWADSDTREAATAEARRILIEASEDKLTAFVEHESAPVANAVLNVIKRATTSLRAEQLAIIANAGGIYGAPVLSEAHTDAVNEAVAIVTSPFLPESSETFVASLLDRVGVVFRSGFFEPESNVGFYNTDMWQPLRERFHDATSPVFRLAILRAFHDAIAYVSSEDQIDGNCEKQAVTLAVEEHDALIALAQESDEARSTVLTFAQTVSRLATSEAKSGEAILDLLGILRSSRETGEGGVESSRTAEITAALSTLLDVTAQNSETREARDVLLGAERADFESLGRSLLRTVSDQLVPTLSDKKASTKSVRIYSLWLLATHLYRLNIHRGALHELIAIAVDFVTGNLVDAGSLVVRLDFLVAVDAESEEDRESLKSRLHDFDFEARLTSLSDNRRLSKIADPELRRTGLVVLARLMDGSPESAFAAAQSAATNTAVAVLRPEFRASFETDDAGELVALANVLLRQGESVAEVAEATLADLAREDGTVRDHELSHDVLVVMIRQIRELDGTLNGELRDLRKYLTPNNIEDIRSELTLSIEALLAFLVDPQIEMKPGVVREIFATFVFLIELDTQFKNVLLAWTKDRNFGLGRYFSVRGSVTHQKASGPWYLGAHGLEYLFALRGRVGSGAARALLRGYLEDMPRDVFKRLMDSRSDAALKFRNAMMLCLAVYFNTDPNQVANFRGLLMPRFPADIWKIKDSSSRFAVFRLIVAWQNWFGSDMLADLVDRERIDGVTWLVGNIRQGFEMDFVLSWLLIEHSDAIMETVASGVVENLIRDPGALTASYDAFIESGDATGIAAVWTFYETCANRFTGLDIGAGALAGLDSLAGGGELEGLIKSQPEIRLAALPGLRRLAHDPEAEHSERANQLVDIIDGAQSTKATRVKTSRSRRGGTLLELINPIYAAAAYLADRFSPEPPTDEEVVSHIKDFTSFDSSGYPSAPYVRRVSALKALLRMLPSQIERFAGVLSDDLISYLVREVLGSLDRDGFEYERQEFSRGLNANTDGISGNSSRPFSNREFLRNSLATYFRSSRARMLNVTRLSLDLLTMFQDRGVQSIYVNRLVGQFTLVRLATNAGVPEAIQENARDLFERLYVELRPALNEEASQVEIEVQEYILDQGIEGMLGDKELELLLFRWLRNHRALALAKEEGVQELGITFTPQLDWLMRETNFLGLIAEHATSFALRTEALSLLHFGGVSFSSSQGLRARQRIQDCNVAMRRLLELGVPQVVVGETQDQELGNILLFRVGSEFQEYSTGDRPTLMAKEDTEDIIDNWDAAWRSALRRDGRLMEAYVGMFRRITQSLRFLLWQPQSEELTKLQDNLKSALRLISLGVIEALVRRAPDDQPLDFDGLQKFYRDTRIDHSPVAKRWVLTQALRYEMPPTVAAFLDHELIRFQGLPDDSNGDDVLALDLEHVLAVTFADSVPLPTFLYAGDSVTDWVESMGLDKYGPRLRATMSSQTLLVDPRYSLMSIIESPVHANVSLLPRGY